MLEGSLILVCDDEPAVRFTVREALVSVGHRVVEAASAEDGLAHLADVDLVVSDLVMGGMSGLDFVRRARELERDLPVILLTARGSERIAVEAMKAGAHDYLTKPFAVDELRLVVGRGAELATLRRRARERGTQSALGRPLVGDAPAFRRLLSQVGRVAGRDVSVLLRGETGTGKELIASLIHVQSTRKRGPIVRFNCAAIPAELAEAELFGFARGAFTGAVGAHRGFFAQADGGTLVLDEIGDLPLAIQAKVLRALQEGEIQPLGTTKPEKVDARVIACTHKDLLAEIHDGRFRADLYYRLAVVDLVVPPLRERMEDIVALAEAFRERYAVRFDLDRPGRECDRVVFTDAALDELRRRPWPGNVRELENVIARALALSDGGPIDAPDLFPDATPRPAKATVAASLRAQVDAFERDLVARTLGSAGGNQSEAARRLGITRTTLIDKMKRFGIQK